MWCNMPAAQADKGEAEQIAAVGRAVQTVSSASTWAVASVGSVHIKPDRDYNTHNFGIGIERTDGAMSYAVGFFRNSMNRNSGFGMVGYAPLQFGLVRLGVEAGLINGYPEYHGGRIGPAAACLARIEGRYVGANVHYIPRIPGKTPETIGVQIKARF